MNDNFDTATRGWAGLGAAWCGLARPGEARQGFDFDRALNRAIPG
jgi:hypothetical protein